MMRAITSTFPPGGKPCTILMSRVGYCWACASPASAVNAASPTARIVLRMTSARRLNGAGADSRSLRLPQAGEPGGVPGRADQHNDCSRLVQERKRERRVVDQGQHPEHGLCAD